MGNVMVGSARVDENGKYRGGTVGDQTGKEVMEQSFYMHSKGWRVLRADNLELAAGLAKAMRSACANDNVGYSQSDRYGVVNAVKKVGSMDKITTKVNADCSSLVRACCIECGFDPGDFNTASEARVLLATRRFDEVACVDASSVCAGDILVTKTKGHTVIVTEGVQEMIKGIDVSSYQGLIDWVKVKADGWQFAILKVIRKDLNPDKQFEINWNGCEKAGVVIQGVYNYTYATTAEKAAADARKVLEILGNNRHPMVWLDYEDESLPKDKRMAEIINAYGDVITAAGCRFGVYFGMAYYNSYMSNYIHLVKPQYRIAWEARYYNGKNAMTYKSTVNTAKKPVNFDGELFGWQYSSAGQVAGINKSVDLNVWYTDIEAKNVAVQNASAYDRQFFLRDSAKIWGTEDKAQMVKKTVTVSTDTNRSHAIVTPLERYMKALGYYTGRIEADYGKTPVFGAGMKKAIMLYQEHVVKALFKHRDGILTARANTWKTLYK